MNYHNCSVSFNNFVSLKLLTMEKIPLNDFLLPLNNPYSFQ